ncbi:uncharacterized protein LOC114280666 [Camellia sinensis]|uniref:F-box domain-containing protein n=1 Tax=Camellia sinensis var. sinensis TaxID=542762 RepID=A0A4V3WMW1_CAMSN|nr:uncharacterized protein LOC114280666 [Camellia sinensis]THG10137.1 hypothetical protein TEA_007865 [Camellia sinensis var. sinensis]
MGSHRNQTTNTVGFSLLPAELIHYIILNLVLPDIVRLKSTNKFIASIIFDQDFVREYNVKSSSTTWLFIYTKRWRRKSMLHGFVDGSNRWFEISILELLNPMVSPWEDLYFLTASGNYFLFASNTSQEVIHVNPMAKIVRKIPPSPLGPRDTSLWRRSGMKLLPGPPGSGHFQFLFAEYHENRPVLFEYNSEIDKWRSIEAKENVWNLPCVNERGGDYIFLSVINGRSGSVLIALGSEGDDDPVVIRPRFPRGGEEQRLAVGFSWGNVFDQLHVYGDGNMMILRSDDVDDVSKRRRMLESVELWGLSSNGMSWEFISMVPSGLIEKIKKPYGVIMGCIEERQGTVRAVLMSNFEGIWDIIWLCYDIKRKHWTWVPLPDCKMKGLNMAGIAFSTGLTLS